MSWRFFEYVGPNGRGVIEDWIRGLPAGTSQRVVAALDVLVSELELLDCDVFDRSRGVGQLRRKCNGFLELILKVDKVQYRPIGFYGPGRREFTFLGMSTEKDRELTEDSDCSRVKQRRSMIINRSHIREY